MVLLVAQHILLVRDHDTALLSKRETMLLVF